MLLYILSIFFVVTGLVQRRKTLLTYLFVVFLWTLYAFSSGNADFVIHQTHFHSYSDFASQTEWMYSLFMRAFNLCGLDYRAFLVCDSLFVLLAYYIFIKRNTRYVAFVLSLYMIFPFCMDVTMVRYTFAFAVILLGLDGAWSGKSWKGFLLSIFIATLIHSGSMLMLLWLLPLRFNNRMLMRMTACIVPCLCLSGVMLKELVKFFMLMDPLGLKEKISIVLDFSQMSYEFRDWCRYDIKIIISFLIMFFVFWQVKKYIRTIDTSNAEDEDVAKIKKIEYAAGLNVVSLFLIPLIVVSADMFRMQLSMSVVFYVAIANYIELRKKFSPKKNNITIILAMVVFTVINLYMWVLGGPNLQSVWEPLFFENVLWG